MSNKEKVLSNEERFKFIKIINKEFINIESLYKLEKKYAIIFFRYKNGRIKCLCKMESQKEKDSLELQLQLFFDKNSFDFLDYAVFPILKK